MTNNSSITHDASGRIRARLLAVIAVIIGIWALKVSAVATLPLAFAVFLIALFWPQQRFLTRYMRPGVAVLITLLSFLAVTALFVGALWYSGELVAEEASRYQEDFQRLFARWQQWASGFGLAPLTSQGGSGQALGDALQRTASNVASFSLGFVLIVGFFVLGLLEVPSFKDKLEDILSKREEEQWLEPFHRIAKEFQRYIVVRTGIGLATGIEVGMFAWIVGLDFAFIWGFSTFLLNYIPTLGSVIAVIPPVLFAFVQFDGLVMPMVVLGGVGLIQIVMGQYVDPLLQGRYLSISPLVVLFAVVFWGWIWGVAGAFIGIPIMVAVIIASRAYPRTRWIAVLLGDRPNDK